MKHVVSISLGSSQRNGSAIQTFGGHSFKIERIGTDGDKVKAMQLLQEMDGKVDAFGLGGTDLYVYAGSKRYMFRETARIAAAAKKTPVVDGSGIKNTLERRVVDFLMAKHKLDFRSRKTLVVCAVDRFGLAEALVAAGSKVVFGDLMFGLGVPAPIHTLSGLDRLAKLIAPVITRLPVSWFYPTGKAQTESKPRFARYFREADIIAGDFHFIRRYAPDNLAGKIIISNTVTAEDEHMLKRRGVHTLVTTTPEIGGRSFGTNILEGVLVALAGKRPDDLTYRDYEKLLDEIRIEPRVKQLAD
ncbi:MAG: quinate 5-dehydrogenase [Negativicutes bacterium]|nr:quinate 5-dehydrogenase [Negativicutes bacterium]